MIKLRVAVRVIPEDVYLAGLDSPNLTPLRDERKFPVIVRNPEDWYIGTLALEIQKRYESLYKHDLGRIKYLKDNEDDCDLDPDQLVADLLVDEGKAARDGCDQHVTIKVIQEQGRAVRAGSIVPDLTPIHFQRPSRPPVPMFSDVQSSLGKRAFDLGNGSIETPVNGYGNKKLRQTETEDAEGRNGVLQSVERSPELIQDTQTAGVPYLRSRGLHDNNHIKPESPDQRRPLHDVEPATLDELEFLPDPPPDFPRNSRNAIHDRQGPSRLYQTGEMQERSKQAEAVVAPLQPQRSRAPITPPSDTARNESSSNFAIASARGHASRSPAPQASSSISRFKQPGRRDLYTLPESEIDDSQMSPRSRSGGFPIPRLVKRIIGIDKTPSQKETQGSNENLRPNGMLNVTDTALIGLDDASGTGPRSASITNRELPRDESEDTEDEIYEDAEMPDANVDVPASSVDQNVNYTPELSHDATQSSSKPTHSKAHRSGKGAATADDGDGDSDKENQSRAEQIQLKGHDRPGEVHEGKEGESANNVDQGPSTPKKKRRKKQSTNNLDNTQSKQAEDASAGKALIKAPNAQQRKKATKPERKKTAGRDSPGEQLSQSLFESARKPSLMENLRDRLQNRQNEGEESPIEENEESEGRLGLGITNSPRKPRAKKLSTKKPATNGTTDVVDGGSSDQKEPGTGVKRPHAKKGKATAAVEELAGPSQNSLASAKTTSAAASDKALPQWGENQTNTMVVEIPVKDHSAAEDPIGKSQIPLGLTEEEYLLMKSREGMTKEEYMAEKKRKQEAAKKEAAEKKKRETALKVGKAATPGKALQRLSVSATPEIESSKKPKQAKKVKSINPPTSTSSSSFSEQTAGSSRSKSTSVQLDSEGYSTNTPSVQSASENDKAAPPSMAKSEPKPSHNQSLNANLHQGVSSDQTKLVPKSALSAPSNTSTTAASERPSPVSKTPKVKQTASKNSRDSLTKTSAKASSSTSTPTPAVKVSKENETPKPTVNKHLSNLRAELRASASKSASPAPKPTSKPAKCVLRGDDSDEDDTSSSGSTSSDEDERTKTVSKAKDKMTNALRLDPSIRDKSVSTDDSDDE